MKNKTLDQVIKLIYDDQVKTIRQKNNELEREYFTIHKNTIPFGDILDGLSYDDYLDQLKVIMRQGNPYKIESIWGILQAYLFFSAGHDMIFKKKLQADIFTTVPLENLIYPRLVDAIKEKYNDVSVMRNHPNCSENLQSIAEMIYVYTEMSALLYFLYCSDFQFGDHWQKVCPTTHEQVLKILQESDMTIGEFHHALVDDKCSQIKEVIGEISNQKLKRQYQNKVEQLRLKKHQEVEESADKKLPITYFLDHSIFDFLSDESHHPSIFEETENKKKKKNNYKIKRHLIYHNEILFLSIFSY